MELIEFLKGKAAVNRRSLNIINMKLL